MALTVLSCLCGDISPRRTGLLGEMSWKNWAPRRNVLRELGSEVAFLGGTHRCTWTLGETVFTKDNKHSSEPGWTLRGQNGPPITGLSSWAFGQNLLQNISPGSPILPGHFSQDISPSVKSQF